VDDIARAEFAPQRKKDPASIAGLHGAPGAAHLADPRAITILTTEHWSLLTARSLVYNEGFSRGAMFLTFLSASLVALGFVSQGGRSGPDFPLVVVAVLGLDLFIGLATLGRLASASGEDLRAVQAMNRLRHAYLEMVPELDRYVSQGYYDDLASVIAVYGPTHAQAHPLRSIVHGLTTMPGMVGAIDSAVAGGLAAAVAVAAGADTRLALGLGLVAGVATLAVLATASQRVFVSQARLMAPRFPNPDQAPGRRNT
jgi:hypothetical protein